MSARDPLDSLSLRYVCTTVRRIAFPRPENFIADAVRQMRRGFVPGPRAKGSPLPLVPRAPGFWKREPPSACYNQEATPYDSLFMNSSFLMQKTLASCGFMVIRRGSWELDVAARVHQFSDDGVDDFD